MLPDIARCSTGASERAPGQEGDAPLGAEVQLVLAAAELWGEFVLHADQSAFTEHVDGDLNFLDIGVGDADGFYLALVLQGFYVRSRLRVHHGPGRPMPLI